MLSCTETVPFKWSDRNPLLYRSRSAAQEALIELWGTETAKWLGLRVERI